MILNDYPFTKRLMNILKQEYDDEAIDKGNSWRKDCTIDYLFEKSDEEHLELIQARNRNFPKGVLQAEIIDEILVLMMLWERLV